MNDRIEELIVAYLHRGSTPDQERELFEACKSNPEVAALLRQHISMSLKLRMLRDKTEVPLETHNALMRRINEMKIAPTPERKPIWSWLPIRSKVTQLGWRHLTGTALATAAAMIALFFLTRPASLDGNRELKALAAAPDTVLLTRVDTVFQARTVSKPVYIVRYEKRQDDPSVAIEKPSPSANAENLAQNNATGEDITGGDAANTQEEKPAITPSLADSHLPETPSYLQQYASMVSSLEKVHLSSSDRVRQ
jgi:hypothetical protein